MEIAKVLELLDTCSTREESKELLKPFKKDELLKIAFKGEIFVKSTLSKEWIIDKITEATIGSKLKFAVLKGDPFYIQNGKVMLIKDLEVIGSAE